MELALETLLNLTDCNKDFASDWIVKYEKTCGIDDKSFWSWVCNKTEEIYELPHSKERIEFLIQILKLILNIAAGDDSNV